MTDADPDSSARAPDGRAAGARPARRRATSPGTGAHSEAPAGRSGDDSDVGWGDRAASGDDRYLADRPPHWGSD